jgi:hypothetical protein
MGVALPPLAAHRSLITDHSRAVSEEAPKSGGADSFLRHRISCCAGT